MDFKVCYFCCCYLGDRRAPVKYYLEDKTVYVKEQVKSLQEFNHSLDKIVFVFNLDPEHIETFELVKKEIPKLIQKTEVEIIVRENYGMSYAAFNEVYEKYRTEFDYYIFNEDDYYFNVHNFDEYLVNKFNSYKNIGYLAGLAVNPAWGYQHSETHAGNSVGITSSKILEELYQKFGCLPHSKKRKEDDPIYYKSNEWDGQIAQTHEIFKMGYNVFDIREDYACPHDMGFKLKKEKPEFEHFVDYFFHWNPPLILPAPLRFNLPTWQIYIIDPQFQKKRSCLITTFYFGDRRRTVSEFYDDRLLFVKKQIETLEKYHHNLDKIVFSFNVEVEHYKYVNEALSLIPQKIQNTPVEIIIRENKGFSYSAFSDAFEKNRDNFDYFVFNEDDYFLVQNNWDEYLIRKYNSLPNTGYLCPMAREAAKWNNFKTHAGHSFGIASTSSLNKIRDVFGGLPCSDSLSYEEQQEIQIEFTNSFIQVDLKVYDIREEYRVQFAQTAEHDDDVWRLFWWNDQDLIIPAIILLNKPHSYWVSYDGPFHKKTNLEIYEQL
jgi:hypothetical protein